MSEDLRDRRLGRPRNARTASEQAIECGSVGRRYHARWAVRGVTLEIPAGEVVGLVGRNGAGKTTLLRLLAGLLWATEGEVLLCGYPPWRLDARRALGYVSESACCYPEMRVSSYIRHMARLGGLGGRSARTRADEVVETWGLESVSRRIIGQLSQGYRQRIALAQALVHEPKVLLLDEPLSGLDPVQTREVGAVLGRLNPRPAILVSSHVLAPIVPICDRIVVLDKGKVLADGTPESVLRTVAEDQPLTRLRVRARGDADVFKGLLVARGLKPRCDAVEDGVVQAVVALKDREMEIAELISAMVTSGLRVVEVAEIAPNFEDSLVERLLEET